MRILFSAMLVIAGFATFFAWRERLSAREFNHSSEALAGADAELAEKARRIQKRLTQVESERLALASELSRYGFPPSSSLPKAKPTLDPGGVLGAEIKAQFDALQNDPHLQSLQLAERKASLRTRYGRFLRASALQPGKAEEVLSIALKREEQLLDLNAVLTAHKIEFRDPVIPAFLDRVEAEFQSSEREALGEATYQQFHDYERISPMREMAAGFAASAVLAGESLAPEQVEVLAQVLANASADYLKGKSATGHTIDWTEVDREMANVLSPALQLLLKTTAGYTGREISRFQSRFETLTQQAVESDAAAPPEIKPRL